MTTRPYFFENEEWYEVFADGNIPCVRLTEKAPPEAVQSFKEYFKFRDKESSSHIKEK